MPLIVTEHYSGDFFLCTSGDTVKGSRPNAKYPIFPNLTKIILIRKYFLIVPNDYLIFLHLTVLPFNLKSNDIKFYDHMVNKTHFAENLKHFHLSFFLICC